MTDTKFTAEFIVKLRETYGKTYGNTGAQLSCLFHFESMLDEIERQHLEIERLESERDAVWRVDPGWHESMKRLIHGGDK